MGATGSTAASSSSFEHQHTKKPYHRVSHLDKIRQGDCRHLIDAQKRISSSRHSNSYFNLNHSPSNQENGSHRCEPGYSEPYNLSDAHFSSRKPVILVPDSNPRPFNQAHNKGLKKNIAGVASRIKQQQNRSQNLAREFSDSMPSLNMIGQTSNPQRSHINQARLVCQNQQVCYRSSMNIDRLQSANQNLVEYESRLMNPRHENGSSYFISKHRDMRPQLIEESQPMRRAISMSSLHNLNQFHYQSTSPQNLGNSSYVYKKALHKSSSNCHEIDTLCDFRNMKHIPECCIRDSPTMVISPSSNIIINQKTPLAKKILKFKRSNVSNINSSKHNKPTDLMQAPSAKKFRQKQLSQQQQQGCPVLPPLPRSQSLHETIKLRATENGQRMRTTGTLRGGQQDSSHSGAEDSPKSPNKVNLVNEILEQRRKQQTKGSPMVSDTGDREKMVSRPPNLDSTIPVGSSEVGKPTDLTRSRLESNIPAQKVLEDGNELHAYSDSNRQRLFRRNNELSHCSSTKFSQIQVKTNNQALKNSINHRVNLENRGSPSLLKYNGMNEKLRSNLANANHKSTLKRSMSHSALDQQQPASPSGCSDKDDVEDLNELARFLYQFKQRQECLRSSQTNNNNNTDLTSNLIREQNKSVINETVFNGDKKNETSSSSSTTGAQKKLSSQQQSPDSTTSSSGFASSNSVSSSTSGGSQTKQSQQTQIPAPSSYKKYPAPPRPDDKSAGAARLRQAKPNNTLLGGGSQLKLSSSLLSIVGECDSVTTIGSQDRVPTNLASILMGGSHLNGSSTTGSSANGYPINNENQSIYAERKNLKDEVDPNYKRSQDSSKPFQQQQLERYLSYVQRSQSELALNHLTSSMLTSECVQICMDQKLNKNKGKKINLKGESNASNKQPYKSKIMNLIKRKLTDRADSSLNEKSYSRYSENSIRDRLIGQPTELIDPVGGQNKEMANSSEGLCIGQSKAINQAKESIVFNPDRVLKLNTETITETLNNDNGNNEIMREGSGHKQGNKSEWKASESLCDLNFDCDLDLIKRCGNSPLGGNNRLVSSFYYLSDDKTDKLTQEQYSSSSGKSPLLESLQVKATNNKTTNSVDRVADGAASTNSNKISKRSIWPVGSKNGQLQQQDKNIRTSGQRNNQINHKLCLSDRENDNWHLVSNSFVPPLNKLNHHQQQKHYHGNNKFKQEEKKAIKSSIMNSDYREPISTSSRLFGSPKEQVASHAQSPPVVVQKQSRWSASSWLSSRSSNESANKQPAFVSKKNVDVKNNKARSGIEPSGRRTHDNLSDSTEYNVSKSRHGKRIDNGSHYSNARYDIEASELLDELDHSLDLVSANSTVDNRMVRSGKDKKAAYLDSYWNLSDHDSEIESEISSNLCSPRELSNNNHENDVKRKSTTDNDGDGTDDDDDDDDDDNYAGCESIYQAMINATFDVGETTNNKLSIITELPSPSSSFIFQQSERSPLKTGKSHLSQASLIKSPGTECKPRCLPKVTSNCQPNVDNEVQQSSHSNEHTRCMCSSSSDCHPQSSSQDVIHQHPKISSHLKDVDRFTNDDYLSCNNQVHILKQENSVCLKCCRMEQRTNKISNLQVGHDSQNLVLLHKDLHMREAAKNNIKGISSSSHTKSKLITADTKPNDPKEACRKQAKCSARSASNSADHNNGRLLTSTPCCQFAVNSSLVSRNSKCSNCGKWSESTNGTAPSHLSGNLQHSGALRGDSKKGSPKGFKRDKTLETKLDLESRGNMKDKLSHGQLTCQSRVEVSRHGPTFNKTSNPLSPKSRKLVSSFISNVEKRLTNAGELTMHCGSNVALSRPSQIEHASILDPGFILKRKTPNAGLKT